MWLPLLGAGDALRAPGSCRVWWAPPGWGAGCTDLLRPEERAREVALHRREDRDRFVTGCVLLRLLLAEVLDSDPALVPLDRSCPSCGRAHGKPRLVGTRWEFSVSHSGDRVGVALGQGAPLGLDVERVAPTALEEVVGLLLTDEERRDLGEVSPGSRAGIIAQVWVRKEAVLKAIGTGLRTDLTSFALGSPTAPPTVRGPVAGVPASGIRVLDLRPGPGHVGSLAALGPLPDVEEIQLDATAPPVR